MIGSYPHPVFAPGPVVQPVLQGFLEQLHPIHPFYYKQGDTKILADSGYDLNLLLLV